MIEPQEPEKTRRDLPWSPRAIAESLRQTILDDSRSDGDALESTTDLLERFGVSRPTLRAALRILEGENLIRVTQGSRSGARICKPSMTTAAHAAGQTLQVTGAALGDLYEAQLAFEPHAARLLAERRDARDIGRLRAHLSEMRRLTESDEEGGLTLAQERFHKLLVELTGNPVLSLAAGLIANVLEQHHHASPRGEVRDGWRTTTPEFRSRGARSMSKLVRLIEAGDAEGAETHWRQHLRNAISYWTSVHDPYQPIDIFGRNGAGA